MKYFFYSLACYRMDKDNKGYANLNRLIYTFCKFIPEIFTDIYIYDVFFYSLACHI